MILLLITETLLLLCILGFLGYKVKKSKLIITLEDNEKLIVLPESPNLDDIKETYVLLERLLIEMETR